MLFRIKRLCNFLLRMLSICAITYQSIPSNNNRPHILSPYTLMAAHLAPLLTSQETAVKTHLSTLEDQNNSLAETIIQQQADMDTLVKRLEGLVADLQKAADMVQTPEIQQATQDARNIHNELRDAS